MASLHQEPRGQMEAVDGRWLVPVLEFLLAPEILELL